MHGDLIKAYDLFDRDDRVRVVVLTAEPTSPAFCAGVSSSVQFRSETLITADMGLQADLSSGWLGMFLPEAEKEGEHGESFIPLPIHGPKVLCSHRAIAHRDGGGQVTLAIFRCRKITICAVNGHAVSARASRLCQVLY